MLIMNQDEDAFIIAGKGTIIRITHMETGIVASTGSEEITIELGDYPNIEICQDILRDIYASIRDGVDDYRMPTVEEVEMAKGRITGK